MKPWHSALLALGLLSMTTPALANEQWPDRPVRLVVPYTPGGGTDGVARNLADKITRDTGWNIVVENKPGAGGNIGMNHVAQSAPDGYALGMGQTANLAINPAVLPSMPFDAAKDFTPVAIIAEVPTILVVRPDAPWQSLDDVIQAAKARPGELRQAVAALGTVGHLVGEMLAHRTNTQFLIVPYRGAAPALNDLIGGQTDLMFATPQSVTRIVESGKLRALAVTSTQRLATLPDVPTIAESGPGYADFSAVDWKAVVAPAGTPPAVIQTLNQAINKALKHPELLSQLHDEGSRPVGGSADEAASYIRAQQRLWADLVKQANVKF